MAKTFRKFSKEHRAKISAAAKKRWAKKRKPSVETIHEAQMQKLRNDPSEKLIDLMRLPSVLETRTTGLIDRMTQAIDKIETQIKRL